VPLLFVAPDRLARGFEEAVLHLLITMALALDADALVLEQRLKGSDHAGQRRWGHEYGATMSVVQAGKHPAGGLSVHFEHAAMASLHARFGEAEERRAGGKA